MKVRPKKRAPWKDLVESFFQPLMDLKPANYEATAWMRAVFQVESRPITMFEAIGDFDLPGTFKLTAERTVPGIGNRRVKAGAVVYVRTDMAKPDAVEVEVEQADLEKPARWYVLTRMDWASIRQNVRKKL